jgi:hypothetical protein
MYADDDDETLLTTDELPLFDGDECWIEMEVFGVTPPEDPDFENMIAAVFEVNAVESNRRTVKVAIDSAAAESVCPPDWAPEFKVRLCAPGEQQTFVNASGGDIEHYGEKRVALLAGERGDKVIGLPFQACNVKRPLAAVRRICEKGNIVQFGPSDADNFIMNVSTKEKVWLKQERGQYVMEASLAPEHPF